MRRLACWMIALAAVGCGSDPVVEQTAAGTGGQLATGGATGAGGSAGSAGTGGGDTPSLYASFVPETAIGVGPALLSFQNETPLVMSLWVGQLAFFAIAPGAVVGPDLAASASLLDDTTLGQHQGGLCVQFRLKSYSGAGELAPGSHYLARITHDEIEGFAGEFVQQPTSVEYVALRAIVHDPAAGSFLASELHVELGGERHAAHFLTYDPTPSTWSYAGASQVVATSILFTDRAGKRFATKKPVEVGGAPGFSVVVDTQSAPGATVVARLFEQAN